MDYFFIWGAKYLYIVAIIMAGVWFLRLPRAQQKEVIIFSLITLPLTLLISRLASWLYLNPRPFVVEHFTPLIPHDPDNGFPSDHTLLVSAVAASIWYFNKKVSLIILLLAVVVGFSRVYVGVHHIIDILGSISISLGVAWLVYILFYKSWRAAKHL